MTCSRAFLNFTRVGTLLILASLSSSARADTPSRPAILHPLLDLPLTLASGAGWLALDLAAPSITRTSCPCNPSNLSGLDRPAVSWHWSEGQPLANGALVLALTGAVAELLVVDRDLPTLGNDLGLAVESTLVTGLLTQGAKLAVARPYPFLYGAVTPSQQRDGANYASFWSGHTAVAMAATVSVATVLDRRGAPVWLRVVAWTAGPLVAVGAGALMASSGNHFPSDVAAGALAGAALGYGTIALHAW